MTVDGETFLRRVVRALSEGGCDPVIVVTSGDVDVEREASSAGAEVLVNDAPGEGPITSLRLAITTLDVRTPGFAWLPTDHPFVTGETVRNLIEEARRADSALTIPLHRGKRGHPAIFSRALFAELTDPALTGGARTVVHRHLTESCRVSVEHPGVLLDIDTPEAWEAARQRLAEWSAAARSGAEGHA